MPLVVGLGNPGRRYSGTRHNAGWLVVERLVARWRALPEADGANYRAWSAIVDGRDVRLMMPMTYMNLSGDAVARWREAHAEPSELLVVTDDVYLPLGVIRLRAKGSSGGHRGLESVSAALAGEDFARLRIGVGAVEADALREYVTSEPAPEERELFERSIDEAAEAVGCWIREGLLAAMNRYNRRINKEVPE